MFILIDNNLIKRLKDHWDAEAVGQDNDLELEADLHEAWLTLMPSRRGAALAETVAHLIDLLEDE